MKNLIIIILMCLSLGLTAQTVKHHSYTTHYNPSIKEPDSVSWNLTPEMVVCGVQKRKDVFKPDPQIKGSATPKDYSNSGYDKGHLFNYADAECNKIDKVECFYMSNMLPQIHPFNAGDWKDLEMQERVWAKVQPLHIVAGGYGSIGKLKAGENIPAYMWKAVYINGKYTVYIMPNLASSHGHGYNYWITPLTDFSTRSLQAYVNQKFKQ